MTEYTGNELLQGFLWDKLGDGPEGVVTAGVRNDLCSCGKAGKEHGFLEIGHRGAKSHAHICPQTWLMQTQDRDTWVITYLTLSKEELKDFMLTGKGKP